MAATNAAPAAGRFDGDQPAWITTRHKWWNACTLGLDGDEGFGEGLGANTAVLATDIDADQRETV